jgi:dihydroorotate dehydrogenase
MINTYPALRSLLFRLPPEPAHTLGLGALSLLESLGLLSLVARPCDRAQPVHAMGLKFPNALGVAAGLDKDGVAVSALFGLGFGCVEVGTVTPRPQPGNDRPRLFRLKAEQALINRMGFNNQGIEALAGRLERLRRRPLPGVLGVNLGRNKTTHNERALEDYLAGMQRLYPLADYLAINISSPNTPGLRDLQAADALRALLEPLKNEQQRLAVHHGRSVPLVLKVAPDLDAAEIRAIAGVVLELELEGLIATNTTRDREPIRDNPRAGEDGGLSGRPLSPKAETVLRDFAAQLEGRVCLIGAGGLCDGPSAARRLAAGARLLQVYTAFVYRGPALVQGILDHIHSQET